MSVSEKFYGDRPLLEVALKLWSKGYRVLPLGKSSAKPFSQLTTAQKKSLKSPESHFGSGELNTKIYEAAQQSEADVREFQWEKAAMVGVSMNGLLAIDLDSSHGESFVKAQEDCQIALPHWPTQFTMNHGQHFVARLPQGSSATPGKVFVDGQPVGDTRAGHSYICVYEPDKLPPILELTEFDSEELPTALTLTNTGFVGVDVKQIAPPAAGKSEYADAMISLARQRVPSARHDATVAFLNLGYRLGVLEEVQTAFNAQELHGFWCSDGSRALSAWQSEVGRWVKSVVERNGRGYGLPFLARDGFDVSNLKGVFAQARSMLAQPNGSSVSAIGDPKVSRYEVIDGCTYYRKPEREGGFTPVKLCNFEARIVAERIETDGEQRQGYLSIAGKLSNGQALPRCDIPQAVFNGLDWVNGNWGAAAIIEPGKGTRDRLRHAIQEVSFDSYPSSTVYAHTGWCKHSKEGWVYLHGGGAIGAQGLVPGIEVQLPSALREYVLPEPPMGENLQAAIRLSMKFLEVAPDPVAIPLWLSIYRAALDVTRFTVFLYGETGTRKSGLAALLSQHFAPQMHRNNLPANWSSTANSLEMLLASAKDTAMVIDDFNPTGSANDANRLHAKAERVLRGQANGQARGRLASQNDTWVQRSGTPPRGLCIVTGEDVPKGHSLRARNLFLEIAKGDVKDAILKRESRSALDGQYVSAMAGFIRFLAGDLVQKRADFKQRAITYADSFPSSHGRTTDALSELRATLDLWVEFAVSADTVSESEVQVLETRVEQALKVVARIQNKHQTAADEPQRFLELLQSVLSSGSGYLKNADANGKPPEHPELCGWLERSDGQASQWFPQGKAIGWSGKDGSWYLDAGIAFAEVQRLATAQGDGISKTAASIWRRLAERELIAKENGQYTVKRTIGGGRPRVLHLLPETVNNLGNVEEEPAQ